MHAGHRTITLKAEQQAARVGPRIHELRKRGWGWTAIAAQLDRDGVPTGSYTYIRTLWSCSAVALVHRRYLKLAGLE